MQRIPNFPHSIFISKVKRYYFSKMVATSHRLPRNMDLYGFNIQELKGTRESPQQTQRRMLRKGRTFTADATHVLNDIFSRTHHPSSSEMRHLADKLCVSEKSVCVWFKNKRTKLAKSAKTPPTSPNTQDRSTTPPQLHRMESVTLTQDHPFYQFSCAWIPKTAPTKHLSDTRQEPDTNVMIIAPDTDTNLAYSFPVDLTTSRKSKHSYSDTDEKSYQQCNMMKTYTDFSIKAILGVL